MTKCELIALLTERQNTLSHQDLDDAVKLMLQHMTDTLAAGQRIELRNFGSFSLHARPARMGRNPRTGEPVAVPARRATLFRPGKELRERVRTQAPKMVYREVALASHGDRESSAELSIECQRQVSYPAQCRRSREAARRRQSASSCHSAKSRERQVNALTGH